jgi:selenoprotein W-related protein
VVAEVLHALAADVSAAELVPGTDGVFVVSANGTPVFSKQEEQRFPEPGEIVARLKARPS